MQTTCPKPLRKCKLQTFAATWLAHSAGYAVKGEPAFDHREHVHTRMGEHTGEQRAELATVRGEAAAMC